MPGERQELRPGGAAASAVCSRFENRLSQQPDRVDEMNNRNSSIAQVADKLPAAFYKQMEWKLAVQQKLRDAERTYCLLAENMMDVIWTTDINLRFTYISPSITRLTGFSVAEAVAMPMEEMLTPASAKAALKACLEALTSDAMEQDPQRRWSLLLEQYHKDGSTIWVETEMSILRHEDNRPMGILGTSRDATKQIQAEEALERYAQMLRLKSREFDLARDELSNPRNSQ